MSKLQETRQRWRGQLSDADSELAMLALPKLPHRARPRSRSLNVLRGNPPAISENSNDEREQL